MKRSHGYSIIELLSVVGIIALAIALLVARSNALGRTNDHTAFVNGLTDFSDRLTRTFRTGRLDWSAYDAPTARQIAPEGWATTSAFRHPLGDAMSISTVRYGGVNAGALQLQPQGLTAAQCADIVYRSAARFARVTVGTTVLKASTTSNVTASAAGVACNSSTAITWILL